MNTPAELPRGACSRTDAVLALHLDGDFAESGGASHAPRSGGDCDADAGDLGYSFVCVETLHAHLQGCATCQIALRRARRLDAVLAADSGRAVAAHLSGGNERAGRVASSEGLLATAWAAARGQPACTGEARCAGEAERALAKREENTVELAAAAPSRRRRWRMTAVLAGATLLVVSLRLVLSAGAPEPVELPFAVELPSRIAVRAPVEQRAAPAPSASSNAAAPAAPPAAPPATPPAAAEPPVRLGFDDAPGQTTLGPAEREQRIGDDSLPLPDRLGSVRALLRAMRPCTPHTEGAADALFAAIAGCGDTSPAEFGLLDEALSLVRASPQAIAMLEHRLNTASGVGTAVDRAVRAAVLAGARLGDAAIDAALRRLWRRHPELAAELAAALRCGARPHGSARLLLDAWHDLASRGALADDLPAARFWFAGQPPHTFTELAGELDKARSEARRRRCLLALGCAPCGAAGRAAADVLLERLDAPRHGEALLAAFALAELAHDDLDHLAALAIDPDRALLRTALARAGHPALEGAVAALRLSPRQRELLRAGELDRFGEVVLWFRDRTLAAD